MNGILWGSPIINNEIWQGQVKKWKCIYIYTFPIIPYRTVLSFPKDIEHGMKWEVVYPLVNQKFAMES